MHRNPGHRAGNPESEVSLVFDRFYQTQDKKEDAGEEPASVSQSPSAR